jgi:hypothetical protein
VETAVTPAGIASLTRGHAPDEVWRPEERGGRGPRMRVSRGYEGLSTFAVRFHDPASGREHVALLLRRHGIARWKLEAVRLGPPARD